MPEQQFVTDFALSRLAPGPGSLLVTLIGWQVAGWAGALVASVAIFLPSSLLLYGLAPHLVALPRSAMAARHRARGLAPVAAGLILAPRPSRFCRRPKAAGSPGAVAGASTLLLSATRLSPFIVLAGGALVFLATT